MGFVSQLLQEIQRWIVPIKAHARGSAGHEYFFQSFCERYHFDIDPRGLDCSLRSMELSESTVDDQ